MAKLATLPDAISAKQEQDFLLRLGVESSDVQDVLPGSLVPTFWPNRAEQITVCLPRKHAQSLKAPACGWYEGEVVRLHPTNKSYPKWVLVKWADKRLNRGRGSWIDICKVAWAPSFSLEAREAEGEAVPLDAPGSWLSCAAARVSCPARQADPEHAFLRRWWTEARRGVVRLSLTPASVAAELRDLHEARHFMASRLEDRRFWKSLNRGVSGLAELDAPAAFLSAVREAKHRGAVYISPFGVYVAPCSAVPGELGLHALMLFHPCELVGSWEGEWLWETEKDRFVRGSSDERARPLHGFPNAAAILKYGMHFQNVDTIEGKRKTVNAMIDSCRGSNELSLKQVSERNEPFGFMNEPPAGQCANCEVQSRVNLLEDVGDGNRYSLLVVAMLPIPPHREILIHYGRRYDRGYSTGDRCPQHFAELSVQSPARGEFGAVAPRGAGPAEVSTSVPSTPLSSPSSADSEAEWPEQPARRRRSKRLQERRERAAEGAAKRRKLAAEKAAKEQPDGLPAAEDSIYVHLVHSMELVIPFEGWFEAVVVSVAAASGRAVLRWSNDRVGSGQQSELDLRRASWLPCAAVDAVALPACEGPPAWLERATASVQPDCDEPSLQVFFARWWAEARWGFTRFSVTPPEVVEELQRLDEVRRFVASIADDDDFWQAVTDGVADMSDLPPVVAGAIAEARHKGACRFFRQGLFLARSCIDPSRYGLHTLTLLYPSRCLGVFDAPGEPGAPDPPRPPRCRRWRVGTLAGTPALGDGAARPPAAPLEAPALTFLAAPPPGRAAGCFLTPAPGRRPRAVLVTSLPVPPMGELLAECARAFGARPPPGPFVGLAVQPAGVA